MLLKLLNFYKGLFMLGIAGGGSPPPAPDYEAAAEATGESNLDMLFQSTDINRYDQLTPLGNLTWTQGPDVFDQEGYDAALTAYENELDAYNQRVANAPLQYDMEGEVIESPPPGTAPITPTREEFTTPSTDWTSEISLSPAVQEIFDKNLAMDSLYADVGLSIGDYMQDMYSQPLELPDFEGYRSDVYDAMMSRIEEDMGKDWESQNAQLYAAGMGRDTTGYKDTRYMHDRAMTDARTQAYLDSFNMGRNLRQDDIAAMLTERAQPINEYSAFQTGSQVQLPSFTPAPAAGTPAGADYMGAAGQQAQYDLAGYNADVAAGNNLTSMIAGLGGAYLMGAPDTSWLWG